MDATSNTVLLSKAQVDTTAVTIKAANGVNTTLTIDFSDGAYSIPVTFTGGTWNLVPKNLQKHPKKKTKNGQNPGPQPSSSPGNPNPALAALEKKLTELTGRRVRFMFATDEELIGGLVARIGSTIYDGSVRNQLQEVERRLAGI